jgi:Flp pilus assembly protein TadG
MARRSPFRIVEATDGAVAPLVAVSLFALIALGGIAFDYARLVGMHSELQAAADQAALAAATQLDGKDGACDRAASAASALIQNDTRFANETASRAITVTTTGVTCGATSAAKIKFYNSYTSMTSNTPATDDATAHFVSVTVDGRTAEYALTPIVAAFTSGSIDATAVAGVGSAICKNPPVMLCNPAEPAGNTDESLDFNPTPGQGMKLVTGDATAPGNFGWLAGWNGLNGANGPKEAIGYNDPPGPCQPATGVTTETGMIASVLAAYNSRFDVLANGNSSCPNQGGGTCSPSANTRKDLVCSSSSGTSCNSNPNWGASANPYRPTSPTVPLSSAYPDIMGYPRDMCQAVTQSAQTCTIMGDGNWDRNAYFKVNYGWTNQAAWTAGTGLGATATRYQVYQWEDAHPSVTVSGANKGVGDPQVLSGNKAAFGRPAAGIAGIPLSPTDRRRISIAVVNCIAINLHGKTTNVPVPKWLDVFLVEPAFQRGSGANTFTDQKEVYVEVIGPTGADSANTAQVVQKSVPYLVE